MSQVIETPSTRSLAGFVTWLREFFEALCNFAFATIVFFMAVLLIAPLLRHLQSLEGFWGGTLTLGLVGLLYLAVYLEGYPGRAGHAAIVDHVGCYAHRLVHACLPGIHVQICHAQVR